MHLIILRVIVIHDHSLIILLLLSQFFCLVGLATLNLYLAVEELLVGLRALVGRLDLDLVFLDAERLPQMLEGVYASLVINSFVFHCIKIINIILA
jgi:hypothetical protein